MKFNCIIDNKGYKEKPKGYEAGSISNRLSKAKEESLGLEEFKAAIELGKTYLSGHLIDKSKGRTKDNIHNINFFSLDVDNHYKEDDKDIYTNYSRKDAIEKVEELLNIKPIMAYTTYSAENINGSERFRLIYPIDPYCDNGELSLIVGYITNQSGDIFDKSCKDASRMFYATNLKVDAYKDYRSLSRSRIDKLLEEIKEDEDKRIDPPFKRKAKTDFDIYSNDIVDQLKQIDISDYLLDQGIGDIEKYKEGYRTSCPIHGGKNKTAFVVNYKDNAWIWKCFSSTCGGGTIIDLHMALNNLNTGEAIAGLLEMYDIKPLELNKDNTDTYTIDKYIGEDKRATKAIIQAVKDHKKTLITGSMGSGKTHFILNDVYNFTKEIGKTLIMVIPSVKQLENLYQNKDIDVVFQDMPVYMGSDRVATTPESLPKILKDLEPNSYVIVADESHERYTSLYRSGYRNKNIERAEEGAYRSIHLTATPRLLKYDNFNKVINIQTKTAISNKITIFKVHEKLEDNMLSMVKTLIKKDMKPILFNNNKETNELFAREVEVKEKITIVEYQEGQVDLFKAEGPTTREIEKAIVEAETIKSGKRSENIAKGKVKADLTCTTSAVMAGIDLYTDDKAILIVNTRSLAIDNLIQLIGRFREGIEIILVVEEPKNKRKYFDLNYQILKNIDNSKELANIANKNTKIDELLEDGLKREAHLKKVEGKWIVDKTEIIAEIYEDWSKTIYHNIDKLKDLLNSQDAFKVESIIVASFNDAKETTMTDLKKLAREERKKIIEDTSKKMLDLADGDLIKVLIKDFEDFEDEDIEEYKTYFKVAKSHMDKVNIAADKLFTSEEGSKDLVKAFRHFYDNTWVSIERDIERKQARKVNNLIKEHGTDFYLSQEASNYKRSIDVVQAKIRHEFRDIEEKQGRISKIRLNQLANILVKEGYIQNKHTKILESGPEEKDRKKALKCLADIVRAKVDDIYNLTKDYRISSTKL